VPVSRRPAPDARALATLPAVGALLGGAAGLAGLVASHALPRPFAAVASFAALVVLSGAIHWDGFLDGCDAFVASVPPERRLEILKDPRHGTFAVVGMFLAGSTTLGALAAIPPARLPLVCAFAAALARASAVSGAFLFPDARSGAAARTFRAERGDVVLLGIGFLALTATSGRFGRGARLLVPLALALALACEAWIARRLGGLTGDAYGFTIVAIETKLFVALCTLVRE
jgi:adenosylcobinamide-GDP ribazoletransferase